MAGANTVGLGLGVIILIILWTVTAFLWVLLSRSQTTLRTGITCLAVLLTCGLFLIPTSEDLSRGSIYSPPKKAFELYDYMFIWRALLILLLFVSIAIAGAIHLGQFWSMKVHASNPVPKRRAQQSPFIEDFK